MSGSLQQVDAVNPENATDAIKHIDTGRGTVARFNRVPAVPILHVGAIGGVSDAKAEFLAQSRNLIGVHLHGGILAFLSNRGN